MLKPKLILNFQTLYPTPWLKEKQATWLPPSSNMLLYQEDNILDYYLVCLQYKQIIHIYFFANIDGNNRN